MNNPFFSIIIPTYNREKHIADTLQSVINQSFSDFEVLVIDNQSVDLTKEIIETIKDKRVFFYQNEQNYERCYSRNRGIDLARGKYILLLDSDDLYEENHLENWYQFILKTYEKDDTFFVSDKQILNSEKFIQHNPILTSKQHPTTYFFLNPIIPGQVCVPAKMFKKYKFRNELLIFEDAAMWMELALENRVVFNSISTFVYRLHEDNSVNEAVYNAYYKRLKAIRVIWREKKFKTVLSLSSIRFSLNASYMGIIRYHDANSTRIIRFSWVLRSIILFPEFGFKNKLLLLLNTLPFISNLAYLKYKKLY